MLFELLKLIQIILDIYYLPDVIYIFIWEPEKNNHNRGKINDPLN